MIQRFLNRTLKAWWLIPAGIACGVIVVVNDPNDESWWWALAGFSLFGPLGLATWVQDRDRRLEEQRKRKYPAKADE